MLYPVSISFFISFDNVCFSTEKRNSNWSKWKNNVLPEILREKGIFVKKKIHTNNSKLRDGKISIALVHIGRCDIPIAMP